MLLISKKNWRKRKNDHYRKRHRYRGGSQKVDDDNDDHDRDDYLKPMTNQTYREVCGECHLAYQPELMPSASWLKILNQLDSAGKVVLKPKFEGNRIICKLEPIK